MTRWQGTADLRSAPLRKAQRNGVSPRSRMTEVSALTPAGKDDALARERRPPVGTAARSAAKGVYHAVARMTLNAGVPTERRTTPELGVLPCRPPAAGCADQRSAFPCLRVALHGGVEPRGEPPPNSGSFPCADQRSAPPAAVRRSSRSSRAPSSGTAPCPVHTKSPPGGGCHGERRLPLPAGSRSMVTGVR